MARAVLKFIRLSPTKARLVAKEIQGMNAEEALSAMEFMPNKAAKVISKVVASAVANASLEANEAVITKCVVDQGPRLKRFKPRARGRATRILKPTAHISVEVSEIKGGK